MNNDGKSNGRAIYAVIRTENLAAALAAFRDRFAANPVAVIVNTGLVEQTSAALTQAGLDVPVASSGGALLGELWLQRPAVDAEAGAVALRQLALQMEVKR